jgi:hypothetical protein
MRTLIIILGLSTLAGCAESAYAPSYIISHTESVKTTETVLK